MMQDPCRKCEPLCTCHDWQTEDSSVLFDHLINNLEFTGLELEYRALEPGEPGRMLCVVGKCRKCGRRLCNGNELPKDRSVDELLSFIYYWSYHFWRHHGFPSVNGKRHFRDVFPSLFHQEDVSVVKEWMRRPENRHLAVIRRGGGPEGGLTDG